MVELKITLNDAGQLNVDGPIENKMVCYGMLELAKEAIRDYADRAAKSGILPVAPGTSLQKLRVES